MEEILAFLKKFISHPVGAFASGCALVVLVVLWFAESPGEDNETEKDDVGYDDGPEKERIDELETLLDEQDTQIAALEEEISVLKKELEATEEASKQIGKDRDDTQVEFVEKIESLMAENTSILQKLKQSEAARRELEEKLAVLDEVEDMDEEDESDIVEELSSLRTENTELVHRANEAEAEGKMLEEKLASLEVAKELETGKINELEAQIETLIAEKTELLQKYNEAEAEKHLAAERMTGFSLEKQQELEKKVIEIEDLKASLENLAEENRNLKQELAGSFGEEEMEQIRSEREELRSELEKYRMFCSELEDKVNHYRKSDTVVSYTEVPEDPEKEALVQEKESLAKEREELEHKAREYQRLFEDLQGRVTEYRSNETVTDESSEYKDHIIDTLTAERDELGEKLEDYKERISSLEFDKEELDILKEDNHRLKKYIEENLKQERDNIVRREEDTDAIKEEFARIDGTLQGLTDENKMLYEEVFNLISIIEEKNRTFGQIESLTSRLPGRPDQPEQPRRSITSAEGAVLTNDDLLEDLEDSTIPKVTHTTNILRRKRFNVFLPKLSTDAKKEKAVPLLEEIVGISKDEAEELVQKVVIPVVKGVEEDEANAIKKRFLKVGILARVKDQV